jgi:hypothetical protein
VWYRETEPELPHKKQKLTHYFDPFPLHIPSLSTSHPWSSKLYTSLTTAYAMAARLQAEGTMGPTIASSAALQRVA